MKCNKLYRGTTPSFEFETEVPLKNIKTIIITLTQLNTIILEKIDDNVIILGDNKIKINLTQEESLLFSSKYDIKLQARIVYKNTKAIASDEKIFRLHEILNKEVL